MKFKLLLLFFSFISINDIKTIIAAQPKKSERSIEERLSGYFQLDNFIDLLKLKTFEEIKNAMNQEFSYEKMNFEASKKIEKTYNTWLTCATEFKSIKIIFILLLMQHSNDNTSLRKIITEIETITNESKQFIINKIHEACKEFDSYQQNKSKKNIELIQQIKDNGHEPLINKLYYILTKLCIHKDDFNELDRLLSIHCPEPINNGFFEYSTSLLDYAIQHKKSACISTLLKHGIKTINPISYKHIFTTVNQADGTIVSIPISSTQTKSGSPFSDSESQHIYDHLHKYKLNSWTPARNSALALSALASAFADIYTFEKPQETKKKKTEKNRLKPAQKPDVTTKIEKKSEVEIKEKSEQKKSRLKRITTQMNEWRKDLLKHPLRHKKFLVPLITILGLRMFKDSIPSLKSI